MTQYMQEAGAMKQAPVKLPTVTVALNMCRESNSEVTLLTPMCWDLALYVTRLEAALAAALPPAAVQAWQLIDPQGRVVATERTCIKAWARINGYKPTVENLLAYEEKGWRVLPLAANEGTLTAGKQGGDGVQAEAWQARHEQLVREYGNAVVGSEVNCGARGSAEVEAKARNALLSHGRTCGVAPTAPLPRWEPCNEGCDPEFNGCRSRSCKCPAALAALGVRRLDGDTKAAHPPMDSEPTK